MQYLKHREVAIVAIFIGAVMAYWIGRSGWAFAVTLEAVLVAAFWKVYIKDDDWQRRSALSTIAFIIFLYIFTNGTTGPLAKWELMYGFVTALVLFIVSAL